VTSTTAPGGRETAAVTRRQCICQEDPANGSCACAQPVTREHVAWLQTYAAQHPERVIILSEAEGEWMSALTDHLPPGADAAERVLAWMSAPRALPPAADLRSSPSLGELLDMLGVTGRSTETAWGQVVPGPLDRGAGRLYVAVKTMFGNVEHR
jgi:hypothetical protein